MKKTKQVLLMLMSMLVGIGLSYALNVSQKINNTVAYIQKMIFTKNGNDTGSAKVVIDGEYGSITMSGALNITTGALKDGTVVTDDLVDGAVNSDKLAREAVTSAKIASGAITTDKIASDAITTAKIASGAITTGLIKNGAITWEKLDESVQKKILATVQQRGSSTVQKRGSSMNKKPVYIHLTRETCGRSNGRLQCTYGDCYCYFKQKMRCGESKYAVGAGQFKYIVSNDYYVNCRKVFNNAKFCDYYRGWVKYYNRWCIQQ